MGNKPLNEILSKAVRKGECLEWITRNKYPHISLNKKPWRGNRLVLFLKHGHIPEGKWALHTCDNAKCINPDHLYWGTPAENVRDCFERKRAHAFKIKACPRGHEYTKENTEICKRRGRTFRKCKQCVREWNKRRDRSKQAKLSGTTYHANGGGE